MNPATAARRLVGARTTGTPLPWQEVLPSDLRGAYAVQDATMALLGAVAGWKVGAKGPQAEPQCAPLPASGLVPSGARLTDPHWKLRGIEAEVALRVGHDLLPTERPDEPEALAALFDAVLPVIEVVETRLADWRQAAPLAKLADLQSHGALVLGAASPLPPTGIDLRSVAAKVAFNALPVADTVGGNPAQALWPMLAWLVRHCAERGLPLRAGQIVTTGSCTGMPFAQPHTRVHAHIADLGAVTLQL